MRVTATTGIVVLLLLLAAVVGALVYWPKTESEPAASKSAAVNPAPAPSPPPAAKAPAVKDAVETLKGLTDEVGPKPDSAGTGNTPAFDVARIEPNGDAVIGGRAAPGATVELMRGNVSHARTVVGPSGDFVIVPKRLPPGNYDLTLRATHTDGKISTSKDSVAVALRSEGDDKPVVALLPPNKPAVVLSKPDTDPTITLAIDAVEGEAGGKLYVSGRAPTGARVRLYLNDAYIASATASAEGRVAFSIQSGIKPGDYRVRLDQVDASGKVQKRAEVPFNAPVSVAEAPAPKPQPPAPKSDGPSQMSQAPAPKSGGPSQTSEASTPKPDGTARMAAAPAGSGKDSNAAANSNAAADSKAAANSKVAAHSNTAGAPPPAAEQMSQPDTPKQEPRDDAAAQRPPSQTAAPETKAAERETETAAAQSPVTTAPTPTTPAPRESATGPTAQPPAPSLASSEPAASSQPPAPNDTPVPGTAARDERKDVVVVPSVDTTVVIRGDSLWRISRNTYGEGIRYSVIYKANRDQIRDPDLIYPGQIFVLPKERREE